MLTSIFLKYLNTLPADPLFLRIHSLMARVSPLMFQLSIRDG